MQAEIQQLYDPDRIQNHQIDQKNQPFTKIKEALLRLKKDDSLAVVLPKSYSYESTSFIKI